MDGLSVAGEWGQLGALIPTLKGKRVLDLGCGYGLALPLCRGAGRCARVGYSESKNARESPQF